MNALLPGAFTSHPTANRYEFRLYRLAEPDQLIGMRVLACGSMTLGRDPGLGWAIEDPARALSRRHCELFVREHGLAIQVSGANGVSIDNEQLPLGVEVPLSVPCTLTIGGFGLAVGLSAGIYPASAPATMPGELPIAILPQVFERAAAPAQIPAVTSASLLEAFCEGAGLDSSLLAGEEPEDILRRAGAIYREAILGIGELMAERDRARSRYEMQRTTIGGSGNNPFKWASSQRLAVDLLLSGPVGFLSGSDAVRSSLTAIKRHIVASHAGLQGCLRAVVALFSPDAVERSASAGSVLKSRSTAQMEEIAKRHAEAMKQLDEPSPGTFDRAYAQAYDAAEVAQR